jgi:hypothetical protein
LAAKHKDLGVKCLGVGSRPDRRIGRAGRAALRSRLQTFVDRHRHPLRGTRNE